MNAESQKMSEDDTSSFEEPSSSSQEVSQLPCVESTQELPNSQLDMKRNSAKKLIEKYYFQLIRGCGSSRCQNMNCASNTDFIKLSPNQAAARAIGLYKEGAEICGSSQPSKIAKKTVLLDNQEPTTSSEHSLCSASGSSLSKNNQVDYLDEKSINDLIQKCKEENSSTKLIRIIGTVFSTREQLCNSFLKTMDEDLNKNASYSNAFEMKKEDWRTLQGERDRDVDSTSGRTVENPDNHVNGFTRVDIYSLRRAFQNVFDYNCEDVNEALNTALQSVFLNIPMEILFLKQNHSFEHIIHCFVIAFEIFSLRGFKPPNIALVKCCMALQELPCWCHARLAKIWAQNCQSSMKHMIQCIQEIISVEVLHYHYPISDLPSTPLQENEIIVAATKSLKILFYSNILAGTTDPPGSNSWDYITISDINDPDNVFPDHISLKSKPIPEKGLAQILGVSLIDCRTPFIPFEEFYNEPLNEAIEMDSDYICFKRFNFTEEGYEDCFSFISQPFILTPATKVLALYYDSRIKMFSERQAQIVTQLIDRSQTPVNPFFKLKVHRDNIIDDLLIELELIALSNPKDFRKQLVVEFIGEQGVDAGGISKEFFQLVIEEIFNPDFGMFVVNDQTKNVWFNPASFENDAEFTLIGVVIGLAIYNNIILAVNFPMVVYRKLMDGHGSLYDMKDWNPTLYQSLKSLLDYEGDDMKDVFYQTYLITYPNVFGDVLEHELKPDGRNIFVEQSNKYEFVAMYCDFLLNKLVERQFNAFKKGFLMVTGDSPLRLLFRPEEIDLIVCGSQNFDFVQLEKSAEYDGFLDTSQTVVDFWSIVHEMPMESKKKLLEFTTGSARAPVGGLKEVRLVISRNGSDSDRLPTSHTCFNVLLLPEYETKEKLKERLLIAINYSKGFGLM